MQRGFYNKSNNNNGLLLFFNDEFIILSQLMLSGYFMCYMFDKYYCRFYIFIKIDLSQTHSIF